MRRRNRVATALKCNVEQGVYDELERYIRDIVKGGLEEEVGIGLEDGWVEMSCNDDCWWERG